MPETGTDFLPAYPLWDVEFCCKVLAMNQNAEAISYYYHLRAQGVDPTSARLHVRMRFGIVINGNLPVADDVTEPVVPREPMEFGGEFCETIYGTSTGPNYHAPPREF